MATTDQPRLNPKQARRVGLELGGFLVAVAGVLVIRGSRNGIVVLLLMLAGALLASIAALRPALLQPLAQRWMGLASGISRITAPILLTLIYLVVFTPMAWLRRTFGRTPIARDADAPSYWRRREQLTADAARRSMERPY